MKSKQSKGATTIGVTLLMTSGLMASALGIRQFNDNDTMAVWVINKDVPAGHVISIADISQQKVPAQLAEAAAGSVQNPRAIIGKKVVTSKSKEDFLFSSDFIQVKNQGISEAIPAGRVLYSLKLAHLDIPVSRLHKGDRLDIVAKTGRNVRTVARDVQLIGLAKSGAKIPGTKSNATTGTTSLVIAVLPEHVYSLAGIDASDNVSLVVHSAFDIEQGKLQDFTRLQTTRAVEVLKGLKKESVFVAR